MGTRIEVLMTDIERRAGEVVWDALLVYIIAADSLLNRFDPSSEVSRINTSGAQPSPELSEWLDTAEHYRVMSGGIFDVRYGGLLDFGGIAKGAVLRYAAGLLRGRGVLNALVDFGGSSILGLGHHPYGDAWEISLPDPYNGETLATVRLNDSALSVSGNRPGYGGHIVDPRSGARISGRRTVLVNSADPLDAEVMSTVLMADPNFPAFAGCKAEIYDL